MKLLGRLIPPWVKWSALAGVVLLLLGAGWKINGWRHRAAEADAAEKALANYQSQVAERDRKHTESLAAERARAERLETDLAAQRTAYTDLLGRIPKLPLVAYHDEAPNADGRCRVPVRTPAFRMCHNAAWRGDAAGLASCGALAGDAGAGRTVSAAGLVRPRDP